MANSIRNIWSYLSNQGKALLILIYVVINNNEDHCLLNAGIVAVIMEFVSSSEELSKFELQKSYSHNGSLQILSGLNFIHKQFDVM